MKIFFLLFLLLLGCSGDEDIILEGTRESVFIQENEISNTDEAINFSETISLSDNLHSLFRVGEGSQSRFPLTAQPVFKDDIIYTMDSYGKVQATNWETNDVIWTYNDVADLKQSYASGGLAVYEQTLVATFGTGDIIAFNADTGEKIWNVDAKTPIYNAPLIENKIIYAQTKTNKILAVHLHSGKDQFVLQGVENERPLLEGNTPAFAKDTLIVGLTNGQVLGISEKGDMLWKEKVYLPSTIRLAGLIKDIVAPLVVQDNDVFVTGLSGATSKINLHSGKETISLPDGSRYAPLVNSKQLILLNTKEEIVAYNHISGHEIWKKSLHQSLEDTRIFSFPMLVNNHLGVFDSDGYLNIFSLQTGEFLKKINIGITPALKPLYHKDHLFLISKNGRLYTLKKGEHK
ncbi:MAG: PQQ-binding-like beta-propeller repeat protein [Alphaproteobacteria bacterium]|nr:PQQ-binding-like beta-propeller repeat protein [Alphaproteobacteria bacterium]